NAGLACEVAPVTTEEYTKVNPQSAPRPAWSILDNKRLRDTVGDEMRSWDVALDEFMRTVEL
ncbi:MAG: dTDP-4-dehydrorhamnose reductase, partial [Coriobacteriales bacterium]